MLIEWALLGTSHMTVADKHHAELDLLRDFCRGRDKGLLTNLALTLHMSEMSNFSFKYASVAAIALLFAGTPLKADLLTGSAASCRQIVTHVPVDDVTYNAGVDVKGNAVVPADLGGGYGITAPDSVTIDIRLDLAQRLGLGGVAGPGSSAVSALIGGEAVVGQVTVRGDDIYWNGQLIPRDSYAALAAACGNAFTAAGLPLPLPKPTME